MTTPEPPTALTPQVGSRLRIAWEHLQADIAARLAADGFDDLRPVHRPFQQFPPLDGLRPTDVAARHGMSKQATNDLLRDLERLGYVTLEPDPDDGRARRIRYTDRGWAFARRGGEYSRQVGQQWADVVGQHRYDQFVETLQRIVDHEQRRDTPDPGAPGTRAASAWGLVRCGSPR